MIGVFSHRDFIQVKKASGTWQTPTARGHSFEWDATNGRVVAKYAGYAHCHVTADVGLVAVAFGFLRGLTAIVGTVITGTGSQSRTVVEAVSLDDTLSISGAFTDGVFIVRRM